MREVLRAEFGDLAPLVRRIPRPSLARTPDGWLVLAAFGGGWLASATAALLVSLLFAAFDPRTTAPETQQVLRSVDRPLIEIAEGAAAVAIARTGGWRVVAIVVGAQAGFVGLGLLRQSRPEAILRERGELHPAGLAPPPELLPGGLLYVVGALLGLWLARSIGRSAARSNPMLEALGVRALIPAIVFGLLGLAVPLTDERFIPVGFAVTPAAALAAGSAIALRADRPLATALLAGALIVGTWIWPLGVSQIGMQIGAGRPLGETFLTAFPAFEAILVMLATIVVSTARHLRRSLPA